jgi:hypothetical protein
MESTTTLTKRLSLKKGLSSLVIILICITGCRSNNSWVFDRVESGNAAFNSSRLTFPSSDQINGIDVEFLKTPHHLYTYLNVHSLPISPLKSSPQHAFVYIIIGEEKHRFEALRREGGQRLLLPEDASSLLISALQKHQTIILKIAGYTSQISPQGFSKYYSELDRTPLFPNPFHLPF